MAPGVDTAYDRAEVYATVIGHSGKTRVLIPPGRKAKLDFGKRPALMQRDEHIWRVREIGRRAWYLESGFTKRSTVENVVYRYKISLGPAMKPEPWQVNASRRGWAVES